MEILELSSYSVTQLFDLHKLDFYYIFKKSTLRFCFLTLSPTVFRVSGQQIEYVFWAKTISISRFFSAVIFSSPIKCRQSSDLRSAAVESEVFVSLLQSDVTQVWFLGPPRCELCDLRCVQQWKKNAGSSLLNIFSLRTWMHLDYSQDHC